MPALTIGAFARAVGLSAKALRLYDELGLLPPARVDRVTGYRLYEPEQLRRARLIAWLRRLGMPLASIRTVCDLDPPAAAAYVARYWRLVAAETAERGRLAALLVDHLSGEDTAMTSRPTLGIRYAARSATGRVRTSNEDVAYAGDRLLAVADGMRGGGLRASTAAVDTLRRVPAAGVSPGRALDLLADAVRQANRTVGDLAAEQPPDPTTLTTLTALLWTDTHLALVHVGDSRAYRLRGGELAQITHDHSYVQSMIDQGRLSPEEAWSHPRRALLVRALDGSADVRPDLALHAAEVGDRYLLCSDGVSAVVRPPTLRAVLSGSGGPESVLDALVRAAYDAGAPDNVAAVVADVVAGVGSMAPDESVVTC